MKHLHRTLAANVKAHPEDVLASKIFLRHLGHYNAPEFGVTPFPDRALFAAVESFQKAQGLKVDGVMKPAGETETAIQKEAQKLQSMGRNGDTILAHISPAEAQFLNDVTDGGSINPQTGLPEFFIGDIPLKTFSFQKARKGVLSGLGNGLDKILKPSKTSEDQILSSISDLENLMPTESGPQRTPGVFTELEPKPKPIGLGQGINPPISEIPQKRPPTWNERIQASVEKLTTQREQQFTMQKSAPSLLLPAAQVLSPAPTLSAEASASNARLAAASVKTLDHTALKRDVTDALKTGGAKAQVEVADLTQQMDKLRPGAGTKLAREVGPPQAYPGLPPRKPEFPQETSLATGTGEFYSKNGNDYYKSDGLLGENRPDPVFKNPIKDGKMREGNMGNFDARRHGGKGYYQHGGADILAKPGTNTTSMHDGKVTKIGIATIANKGRPNERKIKYVEITGNDGLVVRQLYVKPSVKVGDTVKAGETSIGTVEDLAPRYGKNMSNHTHVEVYDTKTIVDNGRTGIKRFKRIDFSPFLGLGK